MKLIVGLGNPGTEYEKTRHNAGFMTVDHFVCRKNPKAAFKKKRGKNYVSCLLELEHEPVLLIKPTTFMNLCGSAVKLALNSEDLNPSDCLIVVDDIHLPFGKMRFRERGSSGGHNGLQSIIDALKTEAFPRLRMGVGAPSSSGTDLAEYVLGDFSEEEILGLNQYLDRACAACDCWISSEPEEVMKKYN